MTHFAGVKVLVVEDEGAVAIMIEDMLEALGCEIVSSAARVAEAREIAATADIDLAVLDVNVAGLPVFPVAEILRERQIPFLFSTGYGASGLPTEFAGQPVLSKPFSEQELQQKLSLILRGPEAIHPQGGR
jgi:CheY-like chemotaxis protein